MNKVDNTANAQNFTYIRTLKQKYNLNQTVIIPTAKLNGVDATYRVILPIGSYTIADAVKLTLPGFYKNSWIVNTIFFQDGIIIFRPARWCWEGGSVSFGDFTLENGVIDFMFKKAYSGRWGFEGVYQVDAGVYTITITNIEGGQTFTLVNTY